jgi:hypothetical protein
MAPIPRLRDERLAWLAIEDQLKRASRRGPFGPLLTLLGSAGGMGWSYSNGRVTTHTGGGIGRSIGSGRMVRYSIACDEQAKRLTAEERQILRTRGHVPPWFLDTVLAEAKKIKI